MSLQEFLSGDVKLETGYMTNVEEIVAFVASWCPHSKNACSKHQDLKVVPFQHFLKI